MNRNFHTRECSSYVSMKLNPTLCVKKVQDTDLKFHLKILTQKVNNGIFETFFSFSSAPSTLNSLNIKIASYVLVHWAFVKLYYIVCMYASGS